MNLLRPRASRAAGIALAVLSVAGALPARAEPSAANRQDARTLLIEGRKKRDAGNVTGAREDFQAAHALMRAPTTGLNLARADEALGRLIEPPGDGLRGRPPAPRERRAGGVHAGACGGRCDGRAARCAHPVAPRAGRGRGAGPARGACGRPANPPRGAPVPAQAQPRSPRGGGDHALSLPGRSGARSR